MHILVNRANWEKLRSKLIQKYSILNDEELYLIDGKEQDMLRWLEKKLEMSENEVLNLIAGMGFELPETKLLT